MWKKFNCLVLCVTMIVLATSTSARPIDDQQHPRPCIPDAEFGCEVVVVSTGDGEGSIFEVPRPRPRPGPLTGLTLNFNNK